MLHFEYCFYVYSILIIFIVLIFIDLLLDIIIEFSVVGIFIV